MSCRGLICTTLFGVLMPFAKGEVHLLGMRHAIAVANGTSLPRAESTDLQVDQQHAGRCMACTGLHQPVKQAHNGSRV
jgi:hypothetical protein